MPPFTPEQRQETAARVTELLRTDARVDGVVLVGSLAGGADAWSDIDLEVAVADDADVVAVAQEWVRRLYDELPVVHHFETAFGETLVRGFLLASALELDLAFDRTATLSLWQPARSLFDRGGRVARAMAHPAEWHPSPPPWAEQAGFAWHDVLHAHTAVRRGRRWQALWYMERVRNRTLALAQERRGHFADFFDYVDDLPPDELAAVEPTLVDSVADDSLLRAVETAARAFLTELRHGDAGLSERLEGPLLQFLASDP
jgi:predicted nucleotidyltransferase